MQARNEILEELRLLSTTVSTISRENPYQVPAGYFDGFPAQVLSLTGEVPFFAGPKDKPLTFSVPEGYFEGFAQNLMDKIKAGATGSAGTRGQSNPIGFGATGSQGQPGYGVMGEQSVGRGPVGQPTPLGESASAELAQLSPLLNGISRKSPYQVPDNYFEQLSPILAPLAGLRDKPLYTVPENYFAGLADEILSRVNQEILSKVDQSKKDQPARIISMDRPTTGRNLDRPTGEMSDRSTSLDESTGRKKASRQLSWLKYSVAAAIAGLIITVGWLRLHNPSGSQSTRTPEIAKNLSTVSDQDLQTYAENNNDQATTESMNSTATLDINDSDVKSLLGDVPDGDLKQYMEEHGGAVDIATN